MILMDLNEQADRDFGRARRKALLRRLTLRLRGEPASHGTLPSFDEVRSSLRAYNWVRRGMRVVDLQQIVGSVGRRRDFDRYFMPLHTSAGERWKRVDLAFHRGEELPPVSLYKIGDRYFVEDGNHRVSVARYHGVQAVEADVTEFRRARRNSGRRARGRAEGEGRVSPWGTWLAYAWPTLLLTIIGLFLRRAFRDPKTPRGDAVLVDLCLGLVVVVASVLWLRVFVSVAFRPASPTTHPSLEFCP